MNENTSEVYIWAGLCLFIGILFQTIAHFRRKRFDRKEEQEKNDNEVKKKSKEPVNSQVPEDKVNARLEQQQHLTKQSKKRSSWKSKSEFSHPWLIKTLKGHNGTVLDMDFSANGKYLASTCDERSVMLWDIRDLNSSPEFRSIRVNIEYDHCSFVSWSPDSRGFAVHRARDNCIELYRVQKRKDGMIASAQKMLMFDKVHEGDVVGFGVSPNGNYIMSCSNKTDVAIWDLKGNLLTRYDTYLMNNSRAKISPCGRFIITTGFSPDVKVMEVVFKTNEFQDVVKAFDLTSHSAAVCDIDFDPDSSHMVTISSDSTWRLYHTNIEYTKGESPRLLSSGDYEPSSTPALVALSPDALVVAVASYNIIYLYDATNGKLCDRIDDLFDYDVTCIKLDATGRFLFVSGSKFIRIFHNVVGYNMRVKDCQKKLKSGNLTSATKERLQDTIKECKQFVGSLKS